ncbi:MAG TPA: caspase family protein, partial [Campylobacterales bacterium]|nr:caspase family protein [Campylobacterales bacterium]
MKLKFLSLLLLSTLFFAQADDRAVRISTKMQTEQRVALVIGNNNYQGDRLPKLINPINDAMAIKNILEHKGFDVIYQEDGGIREMRKVLSTFYKKIA